MPSLLRPVRWLTVGLGLALAGTAQTTPPAAPAPAPQQQPKDLVPQPHFLVRRYPRDRDVAVAVVGSTTLTVGDVVDHLDRRHHPGFKQALEQMPTVHAMLQSDLMAPWVRHLADLEALRQTFPEAMAASERLEAAQSAALKQNFQEYLDRYVADRQAAGNQTPLSQDRVNRLLADFQLRNGLAAELQGTLNHLEPDDYTTGQLRNFYDANPRVFGGQVTLAHILVQHRDSGTGILLDDEGIARANARLADIRARLRPDGSNFEEIARGYSDDQRTARDGGILKGVHRYDNRLPATLCKAAWELRDGDVAADVVETQYGYHLVKRIEFHQLAYFLFTDDAMPTIRMVMQRALQEKRLFDARQKTQLRLML